MLTKRMAIWDKREGAKFLSPAALALLADHGIRMPSVGRSVTLMDDTGLQAQVEVFGRGNDRIALIPQDAPEWAEQATVSLL